MTEPLLCFSYLVTELLDLRQWFKIKQQGWTQQENKDELPWRNKLFPFCSKIGVCIPVATAKKLTLKKNSQIVTA